MTTPTADQTPAIDELCVHTVRALAMDAIQAANSGHPGMPMGMADAAYTLWMRHLRHDPADPTWPDRDRFVLSAGHGSMLLYALLHLTGYDLPLEQLKAFRQWGSQTPGHPEYGHTVGVETTTGPLGQGFANAVGMAIAEARLRAEFGAELVDHHTWVIAGDGCLMEGISNEAASLAGHLRLGRLHVLWDDNRITIDGSTDITFTEDVPARFEALGWTVLSVDGHDRVAVSEALARARSAADTPESGPTLIRCRTTIGRGSPNLAGTSATHGAPLGEAEVALTKQALGLDPTAHFSVPDAVYAHMRGRNAALSSTREAWQARATAHEGGPALRRRLEGVTPALLAEIEWPTQETGAKLATRKASSAVIQRVARVLPGLLGGSADLEGSNGTKIKSSGHMTREDRLGRNVHFGVREHAMAAAANGLALHGGFVPFVGTFLVFHDYMRPAVRLSALMGQQVVYVYTHDSIFLGEDGPTHQPVETLQAMRLTPNLVTIRPCDLAETAAAWRVALARRDGPTALCLTRQGLPELDRSTAEADAFDGVAAGGYVLRGANGACKLVLVATGSEVQLAVRAADILESHGVGTRVVSMPSPELFDLQSREYRRSVLPAGAAKLSIEAGVTRGWERYVGTDGACIGIDRFGASAPAGVLAERFGFTVENVVQQARALVV
jgi:transketolase